MEITEEREYSIEKDGQVVRLDLPEIAHLLQRLAVDGVLVTETGDGQVASVGVSAASGHIFIIQDVARFRR